jgi:nitrous oxide reductase accessory protein NosL
MKSLKFGIYTVAGALVLLLILSAGPALAQDESCQYCGMQKAKFGHSWVVLEQEDGSKAGLCSVHCAAIHMALNIDKPVKKVMVGDYNSKKLIDADKAYFVIGGDKMGVMTTRAKWAFETKDAADKFMAESGGRPATYEEAVKAAFEDMYEDTLMIQKKRKMMKMHKMQ